MLLLRAMKKYSHFIFDIDGTLLDTEMTGLKSLQITIKELMGKELPLEELYQYFGIPSFSAAEKIGYPDLEKFGVVWEEYFQALWHMVKPFPGVVEAVEAIKASGAKTGICTSRCRAEFAADPQMKKIIHLFDYVVCSEDSPRHKPFPDPMLAYMAKASADMGITVKPEECLYFGDTAYDWACGRDAGCDFALTDWKGRGLQGTEPQYFITSSDDILKAAGLR